MPLGLQWHSMDQLHRYSLLTFGMDLTREWEWITDNGRFQLISNSTNLSDEEKKILFAY